MNNEPIVGLFFYIENQFFLFSCPLTEAEKYGDFLIYPKGHMDVWNQFFQSSFRVDYDYYPRGRIVYNTVSGSFTIYYDKCLEEDIGRIKRMLHTEKVQFERDEHYQCHNCNPFYVV